MTVVAISTALAVSAAAAFGPQVLGAYKSAPAMGFGTAERKNVRKVWISQEHMKLDMYGMDSPGPGAPYELQSTVDPKQVHSTAQNPPAWVFGSAKRTPVEAGLHSPGPNYTLPQSVGPQVDSKMRENPAAPFSRESRWRRYEKEASSNSTPGPGAY